MVRLARPAHPDFRYSIVVFLSNDLTASELLAMSGPNSLEGCSLSLICTPVKGNRKPSVSKLLPICQ